MSENSGQNKMNLVPEMDEFREMAADIIEEVIEAIQQEYPDLKPKLGILEESSDAAILYGESYYDLESSIEYQLREKFFLKMLGQTSTEADLRGDLRIISHPLAPKVILEIENACSLDIQGLLDEYLQAKLLRRL